MPAGADRLLWCTFCKAVQVCVFMSLCARGFFQGSELLAVSFVCKSLPQDPGLLSQLVTFLMTTLTICEALHAYNLASGCHDHGNSFC